MVCHIGKLAHCLFQVAVSLPDIRNHGAEVRTHIVQGLSHYACFIRSFEQFCIGGIMCEIKFRSTFYGVCNLRNRSGNAERKNNADNDREHDRNQSAEQNGNGIVGGTGHKVFFRNSHDITHSVCQNRIEHVFLLSLICIGNKRILLRIICNGRRRFGKSAVCICERGSYIQLFMIHDFAVRIGQIRITCLKNIGFIHHICEGRKFNVHSENTNGLAVDKNRNDIRYHINVDVGIQIRLHPGRFSVVDRNVIPADMLQIVRLIHRKVGRFYFGKFAAAVVSCVKKAACRVCKFGIVTYVGRKRSIRIFGDFEKHIVNAFCVTFYISGVCFECLHIVQSFQNDAVKIFD